MLAHWNEAHAMRSCRSGHNMARQHRACSSCTTIDSLLDHLAAVGEHEIANVRMARAKRCEQDRREILGGTDGAELQRAGAQTGERIETFVGVGQQLQDGLCAGCQFLARCGQLHAPADAVIERVAAGFFQFPDLQGDGGLGDVQFAR